MVEPVRLMTSATFVKNEIFIPNAGDPFNACISSTVKYKVVEYEAGRISTTQLLVKGT